MYHIIILKCHYSCSDEGSGLHSVSLSLGQTRHDTLLLDWTGIGTTGNGMVTVNIPDGVDAWVKLRATNNGKIPHPLNRLNPIEIHYLPNVANLIKKNYLPNS